MQIFDIFTGLGEERSGGLSHVSFASPDTYHLLRAAAEMGVDAQTVWRWDADALGGAHVSLDSAADEGADDGHSLADMLVCQ